MSTAAAIMHPTHPSLTPQESTQQYSILLNKQIAHITVCAALCAFIVTNAAEFNAVNVATSFRKLFQLPSTPADSLRWQQAVGMLEEAATRLMQTFQPQQIANILHVTAKNGYETCLLPAFERRAEVMAGDFNSQGIANTLWAYATMGRKPGELLMGQLERRAEVIAGDFNSMGQLERRAEVIAGDFNSQGIVNTLWAYATMGRKPGELLMGHLERRAEVIAGDFNSQEIATTLWAYATTGRKPGEKLMGLLEGRAEAIAGEFKVAGVTEMLVWFRFTGRPCLAFLQGPTGTNPAFTSTGKRKDAEV
jgi:endonuclease/exonuclease/phosphatase family metal-dependent hydrolase